MVECIARLLTFFIPFRRLRGRLRGNIIALLHGIPVWMTAKKVGKGLRCVGPVHVKKRTEIGDHVCLHGLFASGDGRLLIGRYAHLGEDLRIFTRNHNYAHGKAIPYDKTYVTRDVEIGDFVWIGIRVILLPGTKIGEGAIIQAGSVVHGEIPPLAIAGGNPAKVFAWRDAEHFNRLKAEGKFN